MHRMDVCPQARMCTYLAGELEEQGTADCSPQSSYPRFSLGAGVAPAVHFEGAAPLEPVLVVGISLGHSSSNCLEGSGALRSREELTRQGSMSRKRVYYLWRPHQVPQARNSVVDAAVTLLNTDSIRHQSSGLQTHCLAEYAAIADGWFLPP